MKTIVTTFAVIIVILGGVWLFNDRTPMQDTQMVHTEESVESLPNGTYTAVTASSTLSWSAERVVGNSHHGTVGIKDGRVVVAEGDVQSGDFTIDMKTITESGNNERFLTHINSDDFFATAKFPTARFVITRVDKLASGYSVVGNLTVRDTTQEITIPASITEEVGVLTAESSFTIDRTKWKINFDSGSVFLELGDKAIRDEITFDLKLVLRAQ